MIRILHIVSSIGRRSGVMNLLMNYYRKMDRNKIVFDFVYYFDKDEDFSEEIKEYGGKIFKISKPSINGLYKEEFKNIINNDFYSYKIIHSHPIYSFFFFGKLSKKNGVTHFIQHSHSIKYGNNLISVIRNKLLMFLFHKNITDYVACSKEALKLFPKKIQKNNKYKIFTNAIDAKKYIYNENERNKIRKEFNISNDTVVIGHIGRFSTEKNHTQLLNIFKQYKAKNDKTVLFLVGDGDKKLEIEEYAKKLNIYNDTIFAGIRNNVSEILNAFDYFIFPSLYEGLGIVAIESQANGILTICSNGIPNEAIITPCAIKLDINNIDNVINVIEKNMGYQRKNLYKEIANAGYDINEQIKNIESYYESLYLK